MIKLYIALFACLTLTLACKKSNNEPDSGFKCKLNGKKWRPYNDDFKSREAEIHLQNNGQEIFILATNSRSLEAIGVGIYTPGKRILPGKYTLDGKTGPRGFYDNNATHESFYTQSGYEGVLEILKIDTVKLRISGTFYFKAYDETTKLSVDVTKGEFNLAYVTY
ncbi:DUF6252 family protein [Arcticibacter eurypsychrophilus]|uniref:DUF6252 family protein n=1 Tax=Arcticibacter eurypsychrophilus TaxID=1434752 RepID=UPI00084DF5CE|nr:DUF6252 family protein [Arcticibacter eurypsychrophilus]